MLRFVCYRIQIVGFEKIFLTEHAALIHRLDDLSRLKPFLIMDWGLRGLLPFEEIISLGDSLPCEGCSDRAISDGLRIISISRVCNMWLATSEDACACSYRLEA
jgi:hypothetical protein